MYIFYVVGTFCWLIILGFILEALGDTPGGLKDLGQGIIIFSVGAAVIFGLTFVFKKGATASQRAAMTYAGTGAAFALLLLLGHLGA